MLRVTRAVRDSAARAAACAARVRSAATDAEERYMRAASARICRVRARERATARECTMLRKMCCRVTLTLACHDAIIATSFGLIFDASPPLMMPGVDDAAILRCCARVPLTL